MTNLQGVIWDMDGVLVDTGEFHYHAWMKTLQDYSIPFSREIFNNTFGMNNEGILKLLKGDQLDPQVIIEISDQKEINFREGVRGQVKTLPGARSLLEAIKSENIPQVIGSSAPQKNIDTVIGEAGLAQYFDALVSAAEMPGKPDPAVFLEAARKIHTPSKLCVVIEDAIAGIEAAHRAGMKCVAVTTTHAPDSLHAADKVVQSLEELSLNDLKAILVNGKELG